MGTKLYYNNSTLILEQGCLIFKENVMVFATCDIMINNKYSYCYNDYECSIVWVDGSMDNRGSYKLLEKGYKKSHVIFSFEDRDIAQRFYDKIIEHPKASTLEKVLLN